MISKSFFEFYHDNELKFKIQFKKNSFNFYGEHKI